MPAQPLSQSQVRFFAANGFLRAPNVVDSATLQNVRAAYERRVADLLARAGINGGGKDEGFCGKLQRLLRADATHYQHLDISLPMVANLGERLPAWKKLFGKDWRQEAGVFAAPEVFALLAHRGVVAIAKQLLGRNVVASPVQHARIKPPQRHLRGDAAIDANTARTLWHQDEAVVSEEARGADILTVWIAVGDATVENGCMQAVAGSHLREDADDAPDFGLAAHCPGKGAMLGEIYIPEDKIDKTRQTALEARAGDVILLHRRVLHGAGENKSDDLRWSFDLRYQATGGVTGRDFFPSCVVAGAGVCASAAEYKQNWLSARDEILSGKRQTIFNARWNKYGDAPLCA